jgi:hypothetical protein
MITITPGILFTAGFSISVEATRPYAIFGYGSSGGLLSITNLVSNTGVVSTDITGVGTPRSGLAAASYG